MHLWTNAPVIPESHAAFGTRFGNFLSMVAYSAYNLLDGLPVERVLQPVRRAGRSLKSIGQGSSGSRHGFEAFKF